MEILVAIHLDYDCIDDVKILYVGDNAFDVYQTIKDENTKHQQILQEIHKRNFTTCAKYLQNLSVIMTPYDLMRYIQGNNNIFSTHHSYIQSIKDKYPLPILENPPASPKLFNYELRVENLQDWQQFVRK